MNCRFCNSEKLSKIVDLEESPPSNAYLDEKLKDKKENTYPLKIYVCEKCWLVQTKDFASRETFFDQSYAYFSSASKSWLDHALEYTNMIVEELELNSESFVTEIASNDGYLLKNFIEKGVPCLGVEPTKSTATESKKLGVKAIEKFFGENTSKEIISTHGHSNLVIGNNVFAHVPDINDFTRGLKHLLDKNGTITLEFPHIVNLIELNQWDTIYHEHYSYFSLLTVNNILKYHGLKIYKVQKIDTHGGSLRIFASHDYSDKKIETSVSEIIDYEKKINLNNLSGYSSIQIKADKNKNDVLNFLREKKHSNKIVVGYGAAAKGNTLLNYAEIKKDLIPVVFDASPSKQGKFLPGSKIPILKPESIKDYDPDFILIFPWNIKDEVIKSVTPLLKKKAKFLVASPDLKIL